MTEHSGLVDAETALAALTAEQAAHRATIERAAAQTVAHLDELARTRAETRAAQEEARALRVRLTAARSLMSHSISYIDGLLKHGAGADELIGLTFVPGALTRFVIELRDEAPAHPDDLNRENMSAFSAMVSGLETRTAE